MVKDVGHIRTVNSADILTLHPLHREPYCKSFSGFTEDFPCITLGASWSRRKENGKTKQKTFNLTQNPLYCK